MVVSILFHGIFKCTESFKKHYRFCISGSGNQDQIITLNALNPSKIPTDSASPGPVIKTKFIGA